MHMNATNGADLHTNYVRLLSGQENKAQQFMQSSYHNLPLEVEITRAQLLT